MNYQAPFLYEFCWTPISIYQKITSKYFMKLPINPQIFWNKIHGKLLFDYPLLPNCLVLYDSCNLCHDDNRICRNISQMIHWIKYWDMQSFFYLSAYVLLCFSFKQAIFLTISTHDMAALFTLGRFNNTKFSAINQQGLCCNKRTFYFIESGWEFFVSYRWKERTSWQMFTF